MRGWLDSLHSSYPIPSAGDPLKHERLTVVHWRQIRVFEHPVLDEPECLLEYQQNPTIRFYWSITFLAASVSSMPPETFLSYRSVILSAEPPLSDVSIYLIPSQPMLGSDDRANRGIVIAIVGVNWNTGIGVSPRIVTFSLIIERTKLRNTWLT